MTIKRLMTAIALASLMGIVLPVATAQAPPCFTFDGEIKTIQCPVSFRPTPVQYYSNAQSGFSQATDNGDDELPSGFFDQQTINTLRERSAQNQTGQPQPEAQEPEPEPRVTNNTAGANQNQTAPAATNLTSTDIEPVRNGLNTVRQSLEHNDTQAAIDSINKADGALFAIMLDQGKGPLSDALTTLSDDIETTRDSVRNLDNVKAFADLNAADAQLLVIAEMLPRATATENPQPQPEAQEAEVNEIFTDENQSADVPFVKEVPANETEIIPPTPEPEPVPVPIEPPVPAVQPEPQPEPVQQEQREQPTIRIPLNQTQQELITIEEVGGLNKTTHEKTTISIVEGNRTTHREITTTEVPL